MMVSSTNRRDDEAPRTNEASCKYRLLITCAPLLFERFFLLHTNTRQSFFAPAFSRIERKRELASSSIPMVNFTLPVVHPRISSAVFAQMLLDLNAVPLSIDAESSLPFHSIEPKKRYSSFFPCLAQEEQITNADLMSNFQRL